MCQFVCEGFRKDRGLAQSRPDRLEGVVLKDVLEGRNVASGVEVNMDRDARELWRGAGEGNKETVLVVRLLSFGGMKEGIS